MKGVLNFFGLGENSYCIKTGIVHFGAFFELTYVFSWKLTKNLNAIATKTPKFSKIQNFQKSKIFKYPKFSKIQNFQKSKIFKYPKFSNIQKFQKSKIFKNPKFSKIQNFQKSKILKNPKFSF